MNFSVKEEYSMIFLKNEKKIEIDIIHCESGEFKGVTEFWFKSNYKIANLMVVIKVEEFIDIISGLDSISIKKNNWTFLAGYENVKENQKWRFTFTGKLNGNNEKFNSFIDYKI